MTKLWNFPVLFLPPSPIAQVSPEPSPAGVQPVAELVSSFIASPSPIFRQVRSAPIDASFQFPSINYDDPQLIGFGFYPRAYPGGPNPYFIVRNVEDTSGNFILEYRVHSVEVPPEFAPKEDFPRPFSFPDIQFLRVNSASVAEPSILIGVFATGTFFFIRRKKFV